MEIWDLYTKDRVLTGKTITRGEEIPKGFYHLAVTTCIFNSKGEMLIQHRVPFKDDWANFWDLSCGGSAISGDTSQTAAEREVFEELGLKINLQNERPHLTNHFVDGFTDVYILNLDVDLSKLKLQAEEVQNVKWATMEEIFTMLDEKTFIPYHKAWIELLFHRSKIRSNYTKEIKR
jgi:isopentenyldiphosphate isomerase